MGRSWPHGHRCKFCGGHECRIFTSEEQSVVLNAVSWGAYRQDISRHRSIAPKTCEDPWGGPLKISATCELRKYEAARRPYRFKGDD